MSDVLGGSSKVSRTDRREGGTKFFEIVGNAFNSKTKLQDQSETDAELTESSEERRFVVDFENLFVIANVWNWDVGAEFRISIKKPGLQGLRP